MYFSFHKHRNIGSCEGKRDIGVNQMSDPAVGHCQLRSKHEWHEEELCYDDCVHFNTFAFTASLDIFT